VTLKPPLTKEGNDNGKPECGWPVAGNAYAKLPRILLAVYREGAFSINSRKFIETIIAEASTRLFISDCMLLLPLPVPAIRVTAFAR
jgi:hypothetical protein